MIRPRRPVARDEVARHYDDLDRYYRELWGEHLHHGLWRRSGEDAGEAVRNLVDYVATMARIRPGESVCDVGSGYGATARMLAEEFGARALGLTVSRAQFEHATSRARDGNPTYLLRDWCDNGLPAASQDVVVAIESVSHVADKRRFFSEIRRVLRPSGRAVVCAWLAREGPRPWEVRHLLEPICREGRLPGLGTARDYRALAEGAGLADVELRDLTASVKRTWPICASRLARRAFRDRELRRFAREGPASARAFVKSVFRIWAAYELGAMRYGVLRMRAPA